MVMLFECSDSTPYVFEDRAKVRRTYDMFSGLLERHVTCAYPADAADRCARLRGAGAVFADFWRIHRERLERAKRAEMVSTVANVEGNSRFMEI